MWSKVKRIFFKSLNFGVVFQAVLLVVLGCAVWSCRAQAQTSAEDLKRPYSFGFNIENMQHRQEMKGIHKNKLFF